MSAEPTLVTQRHFEYITSHTDEEDPFFIELKQAASAAGIPAIWISHSQAVFIQILLRLSSAREVVEVGTLAGYSALMMAAALPEDGRVRTIELADKHADFAQEWADNSGFGKRVEIHRGKGADVLKTFENDSADAAFLDADKLTYPTYLKECMRIVRKGGLIMVDNAFAFGQIFDQLPTDRETPAIRAFNETMKNSEGLQSVITPFGDGMWVAVKQ